MAWAKTFKRTTSVEPYDSVLFCGICGLEVHVTRADSYGYVASGQVHDAERAAEQHLAEHHRFRYWLWRRFGWRWLVAGLA